MEDLIKRHIIPNVSFYRPQRQSLNSTSIWSGVFVFLWEMNMRKISLIFKKTFYFKIQPNWWRVKFLSSIYRIIKIAYSFIGKNAASRLIYKTVFLKMVSKNLYVTNIYFFHLYNLFFFGCQYIYNLLKYHCTKYSIVYCATEIIHFPSVH